MDVRYSQGYGTPYQNGEQHQIVFHNAGYTYGPGEHTDGYHTRTINRDGRDGGTQMQHQHNLGNQLAETKSATMHSINLEDGKDGQIEDGYRAWLKTTYKPLFQPYEAHDGIPNEIMLRMMADGTIHDLRREKRETFLKNMDKNRDGRITWEEFYTVMIDPKNEDEYRAWLTKMYKHLFDPHEKDGGVPKNTILQYMNDGTITGLRENKKKEFIVNMDVNRDNRISWEEFYKGMTKKRRKDLPLTHRLLDFYVRGGAPNVKKRENRLRDEKREKYGTDHIDGAPVEFHDPSQKKTGKELIEEEEEEEYVDYYNCRPPPIIVPLASLATIIAFIVYAVEIKKREIAQPNTWNKLTFTSGVAYWSPLLWDPLYREQAWRWVSYSLLHQGYYHIIFNTILLLGLGIPLEIVHKFWRVGPVLIGGIIAGSITVSIFDYNSSLVGISGGCYCLVGAHYAVVIMNWEELQNDWLKIAERPMRFLSSGVMRLILLTLFVALDFGLAIYAYKSQGKKGTSFAAHIGGIICGVLLGVAVLKNIDVKPFERFIFWIGLIGFICYLVFGVFWNIFYPNFPTPAPNLASLGTN